MPKIIYILHISQHGAQLAVHSLVLAFMTHTCTNFLIAFYNSFLFLSLLCVMCIDLFWLIFLLYAFSPAISTIPVISIHMFMSIYINQYQQYTSLSDFWPKYSSIDLTYACGCHRHLKLNKSPMELITNYFPSVFLLSKTSISKYLIV